jgi:hypothetical protein
VTAALDRRPGVTGRTEAGPLRPLTSLIPAQPQSPVGRTSEVLRTDPSARTPLRDRELDLASWSDRELHALTDALLAEKHRRIARWIHAVPAVETLGEP